MTTELRKALEEMIAKGNKFCHDTDCWNCPFDEFKECGCGLALIERLLKENDEKGVDK